MIYFTADLHFGHENILRYANRSFENIEDMNESFIYNWNNTVGIDDEIYILGDFSQYSGDRTNDILKRLNGKKYLIIGNHEEDYLYDEKFDKSHFEWIKDYFELSYNGMDFILFHYPIEEWNKFFDGGIHLHGHQHHKKEYNIDMKNKGIRKYDVGVDANDYRPVSVDFIHSYFELKN